MPARRSASTNASSGPLPSPSIVRCSPRSKIVALIVRRPVRRGPYVATALLLVTTVAATFVLSQTPLRQLAENAAASGLAIDPALFREAEDLVAGLARAR